MPWGFEESCKFSKKCWSGKLIIQRNTNNSSDSLCLFPSDAAADDDDNNLVGN